MIDQATINYLNTKYHPEPTETYVHINNPIEFNRIAETVEKWGLRQMYELNTQHEFSLRLIIVSDTNTYFNNRETHNHTFKKIVNRLLTVGDDLQNVYGSQYKSVRLITAKPNGNSCPYLSLNQLILIKNSNAEKWLLQVKCWLAVIAPTLAVVTHTPLNSELTTDMVRGLLKSPENGPYDDVDLVIRRTQTAINAFTDRTLLDFFPN